MGSEKGSLRGAAQECLKPWLNAYFARPLSLRRLFSGPIKKDGPNVELDVYSFMTTAPNALKDSINHERMPVLLSKEEDFETWLTGTPEKAFALARSFDPNAMRIVQSGKDKEDLLGLPSAEQPSLL